jgi:hypothetical protein
VPTKRSRIGLDLQNILGGICVWKWGFCRGLWAKVAIPIGLRTRELRHFYFISASCPGLISEYVTPKDLVVTSCTGLLKCWFWCIGKLTWWSTSISKLPLLYISEHVLNLDEHSSAPFRILEVLMILISAFITNSWEWFVMPAK